MRFGKIIISLACLILLSSLIYNANGQNASIVYEIEINQDNSAVWTVIQVQDINGTIDSWEGFQYKVGVLIDEARTQTQRQMVASEDSFQLSSRISKDTQSKTTEYKFTWLNFSTTQNNKVIFGDIFKVPSFFLKLYGDGSLQIHYPYTYSITSISPEPNNQDNTTNNISWIRTQDFINGQPSITLITEKFSPTPNQNINFNNESIFFLIGIIIALIIITLVGGYYLIKIRKIKKSITSQPQMPKMNGTFSMLESDEEKIIKIIRTNQGTIFQSMITEQCNYSKAKTSQLLTALEKEGVVRRYKKGRDKIVILVDQDKSG